MKPEATSAQGRNIEMDTKYRHKRLKHSTSIRLFHLEAGSWEDPLRGKISLATIETHPRYEAVSYVWGSEVGKPTIAIHTKVGDRYLEITQNLGDALRRFRRPDAARTLWIDSICIVQEDVDEKNQQVPLMGAIYRQAAMVLIWLGEDPDSTKPAIIDDCMWKLYNAIDAIYAVEAEESHGLPDNYYKLLNVQQHNPDELHQSLGIPLLDSTGFQGFQELLRNPWFVRAWTWQESHVAKDRVFHRGDQSWQREPIVKAVIAVFVLRKVTGLEGRYAYETRFAMDMLGNEKFWIEQTEYLEFRRILRSRRGSGCKYASDLVYCLLGGARNNPDIQVDYKQPFEAVFTQCTWKLILQNQDFSIFRDLERNRLPSNLPSWVPDWRVTAPLRSDVLGMSTALRYRAMGSSRPIVEVSRDLQVLTASGIILDRIWKIEPGEAGDLEFRIAAIIGSQEAMIQPYAPTGETLLHAMQRTWFVDTMGWAENEGYLKRWTPDAMERYDAVWNDKDVDKHSTLRYGQMMHELTSKRYKRSAFVTADGHIGIAANTIRPGDVVALLLGGDMPFVLRHLGEDHHYTLVADCYVHGFMDGEALTCVREEADPEWDPNDTSWLEHLHEEDLPFAVQKFHIH